jgi:tetratricopeptide (TPR) repeat protein
LEKARTYAESALRLAPELGEAHLAEARYFYEGVQDFQRALPEFTRAQEALPNNADVQTWMGNLKRRMGNWAEAVQHQRKAMELDPHNPWALDLIVTFRLLRNYDDAERTIDRAQIGLPQLTNQFRGSKALIALCKGDLKGCKIVLQSLPPDEHQGFAPYVRARFALFERNYDEADQILNACTQATDFERQWVARDKAFVARARGDAAKTRDAFQAARKTFENELQSRRRPNDPQLLSILAVYDAGLGRKEEALRESQKAIDLFPKGGDATDGPEFLRRQALVFAWAGERDRALQLLSDLVRRPGPLSPGELKFDPGWDDLRQDPRFAEVVAACERPAKIDNH